MKTYTLTKSGHPRVPALQQLIDVLSSVPPQRRVAMMNANWKGLNIEPRQGTPCRCGSPACFAGWYMAIAHPNDTADEIAQMMGFKFHYELEVWAGENDLIWGNLYGPSMFASYKAFDMEYGKTTVGGIFRHLKKVKKRLHKANTGR